MNILRLKDYDTISEEELYHKLKDYMVQRYRKNTVIF